MSAKDEAPPHHGERPMFSLIHFQDALIAKLVTFYLSPTRGAGKMLAGLARRHAVRSLEKMGFTHRQAWDAVDDAFDMAELKIHCEHRS